MDPLIQKIILATDFSEASREASYHAVLLAQTYNAELKALHVFNPRPLGIPYYKAKKRMHMNKKILKKPGSEERTSSRSWQIPSK